MHAAGGFEAVVEADAGGCVLCVVCGDTIEFSSVNAQKSHIG